MAKSEQLLQRHLSLTVYTLQLCLLRCSGKYGADAEGMAYLKG